MPKNETLAGNHITEIIRLLESASGGEASNPDLFIGAIKGLSNLLQDRSYHLSADDNEALTRALNQFADVMSVTDPERGAVSKLINHLIGRVDEKTRAARQASDQLIANYRQLEKGGDKDDTIAEVDRRLIAESQRLVNRARRDLQIQVLSSAYSRLNAIEKILQMRYRSQIRSLRAAPFDVDHYRGQLAQLGIVPSLPAVEHYVLYGAAAGLDPHPLFRTSFYLSTNQDVALAGVNPFHHYLTSGDVEGRSPHPLFDPGYYLDRYKDVASSGQGPWQHYVRHGAAEGRNPHPFFEDEWYTEQNGDAAIGRGLEHYVLIGGRALKSPNPMFDAAFYAERYSAAFLPDETPLEHYVRQGFSEGVLIFRPQSDGPDAESVFNLGRNRPTILVVAHSAGARIYGAERSLIDVIRNIDRTQFRVVLALPNPAISYVEVCRPHVDRIVGYPRSEWRAASEVKEDVVEHFERLIESEGVGLVYGNTIMVRECFEAARRMGISTICHVRELISGDRVLANHIGLEPDTIVEEVKSRVDMIVSNSMATSAVFGSDSELIYNAVDTRSISTAPREGGPRVKVGLLGSNIAKKGLADFFTLAKAAKTAGLEVEFVNFGPITREVEGIIAAIEAQPDLADIKFEGYTDDPIAALRSIDVVLSLSGFAESFGRTVAEAMALGRPAIAHELGALPELIEHEKSGFLIAQGDPLLALPYLERLVRQPELIEQMGAAARQNAEDRFSYEILGQQINDLFARMVDSGGCTERPSIARASQSVSVIVPNYNYAAFLPERLWSILGQTVPPKEIIFLDDASSDDSVVVARDILEQGDVPYRIVENQQNEGVYAQWIKGIGLATGELIWIAEADDRARATFLETVLGRMNESVVLSYSQSRRIDSDGAVTSPHNRQHTDAISASRWQSSYVNSGILEVADYLSLRNTIPNASAVVFRKAAFDGAADQLRSYRRCGDWFMYSYLLRAGAIAYTAKPMNDFRRHDGSVTTTEKSTSEYLQEIAGVRRFQCQNFPILTSKLAEMDGFLDRDYTVDSVERNSRSKAIAAQMRAVAQNIEARRSFAFISTNNGSYTGGSEVLWQDAARRLRAEGHDVHVLSKSWRPPAPFFAEFERLGIRLHFKEKGGFDAVLAARPDLTIISTGDQDEGVEYFDRMIEAQLPYVIVNQLTKEPRFWPVRSEVVPAVTRGHKGAAHLFFTSLNNRRVQEQRLGVEFPYAEVHFNPYHIDRDEVPPLPGVDDGFHVAVPSKLLFVHKGQDLLVDAMRDGSWAGRNIFVNFYGAGPDEQELRTRIADAGLTERLHLKGRVGDIGQIWRDNHALLMPSRMEGLPIMVVSAMLSARPCFVTDIGGHAEVITEGLEGFIAPNPDPGDVAAMIERAWAARDRWRQMGEAARRRILDYLPEDPTADFLQRIHAVRERLEAQGPSPAPVSQHKIQ